MAGEEEERKVGGVGEELERSAFVHRVSRAWQQRTYRQAGRQGQSEGCNEIITLIKFVLSTERAGRDDKSKARQAAPPLDATL